MQLLKETIIMNVDRAVRLMAGVMILISLALTHWVHPNWIWVAVFVAVNLFQSAFTNWCPAMTIFRKCGLKD